MPTTASYRFDHVHLRSRDAVAAAAFYVEMFGARETGCDGAPSEVSRVVLDLGGLTIFIEQAAADLTPCAEAPHLGIEHIGLLVEDIDGATKTLRGRGVTFTSGILERRPGLRVTFLEGPDGAVIELLERSTA